MTETAWRRLPLKRIASLKSGDAIAADDITGSGDFPVYGGNGVRGFAATYNREGDHVLVGRQGALCGNVTSASGQFWASEHAVVVTPRPGTHVGWLRALLRSMSLGQYSQSAAQPGLAVEVIANLTVLVPPIQEQAAIADYLDAETARIDRLVAQRRTQLMLSGERRIGAVRECFRGNGQSSGRLPWLLPVPDAWPIVHLRWLVQCLDGRRIPVNREERATIQGDVPYWGANGVVDHVDRALFDEALVLLGEDGAPFFDRDKAKAFFVDEPVWVNNHMHVLKALRVRPWFLMHYLNLVDYADFLEGSTRDKLTQGNMGAIPVPIPTPEEQTRIELQVAQIIAYADSLDAVLNRQIYLLIERRQALITAAVTGQIEIPGVAA